jgi:signal transduction histidine kinase/ActR/RegA family two-component response regulator
MGHHPLLVDRNGVERSIEESASPIRDGTGQASGVVLVFRDVTERRRAELRLKTSEETVRSLLRVSTKLNSSLNVDELLDILVEEALQLAGAENGVSGLRTPEGMTCQRYFMKGKPMLLSYCWPPKHGLPGWVLVNKRPYLTNDAATDGQIVPELRDQFGVREALSIPILDVRGEVLGFFELHNRKGGGGFTPTDQEQLVAVSQAAAIAIQNALAFRKLQQAEAALKEADRRKDEFLATLAHELRNPLAPIRNALQIMRLCDNDPQTVERVRGVMERQLQHMVRLIDDLLDVSRITRNRLELRRERVELSRVVQAAVETARPLIDSREQRLTVTLPTEPISLDADLTRLAQVFANLLNNAAKYTRAKGEIWLTVLRRPSEVVVTVRDNGIGFTQEQRARLFQMFTQASASPDQAQSGLGIGLALARGLVEMHGGTIEASSNGPGLGSEFTVRLPAPSRVDAQGAEGAPIEKAQPHERRRILVVDDNRDAAESLAMMLQLLRHEVRVAHDGVEAIEATAAFRPEVVLLDIGMPRMNGYEAARHIRKQPGGDQVVLIALTGWGQAADKQLAMEAGFDLHLTKPVDPSLLVKRMSEVQRLRR